MCIHIIFALNSSSLHSRSSLCPLHPIPLLQPMAKLRRSWQLGGGGATKIRAAHTHTHTIVVCCLRCFYHKSPSLPICATAAAAAAAQLLIKLFDGWIDGWKFARHRIQASHPSIQSFSQSVGVLLLGRPIPIRPLSASIHHHLCTSSSISIVAASSVSSTTTASKTRSQPGKKP